VPVTGYSNEGIIRSRLAKLGCTENSLVAFNNIIGRTRFFEAMSGKRGKGFSQQDAEKLLEFIGRLEQLQANHDVVIDWSKTTRDRIDTALVVLQVNRISQEMGSDRQLEVCI
jgi:hypothetical protein